MKNSKFNEVSQKELIDVNGGHCPPEEGRGAGYYIGHTIGTFLMWIGG